MLDKISHQISLDNLSILAALFERNAWPKHIVTISTLETILRRLGKYPELRTDFKLFVLSDDWLTSGEFYITYDGPKIESFIFFDSLSDVLSDDLVNVLKEVDYTNLVDFYSIRNVFRPMALKIVEDLNLEIHDDTDAICYYLPRKAALEFKIQLPPNIVLKPLNDSHVAKANSAWPHRYEGSDQFIAYSIRYHLNLGLFNEADELLAWSLRYDNGSIGVLQVDENHLRKGYGSLIAKALSRKIAEEFDCDITALIKYDNVGSISMFSKLGFKAADRYSWFVFKTK